MKSLFVLILVLALALLASACSRTANLTAPTPPAAASPAETLTTITYAINIPNRIVFQDLLTQFPDGRLMAPLTAQQVYDYTATYRMANVYYGPLAPATSAGMGLVVAPVSVAGQETFTAAEWPNEYGQAATGRVQWLGRFAYTIANCQTAAAVTGCR